MNEHYSHPVDDEAEVMALFRRGVRLADPPVKLDSINNEVWRSALAEAQEEAGIRPAKFNRRTHGRWSNRLHINVTQRKPTR